MEARLAIEHIVIPKGQPVELLPRCSEIMALQIKLVEGYQLVTEKAGTELNLRLRILPLHISAKENNTLDLGATQDNEHSPADVDVSIITSGTSVTRLPILPD
eukprot:Gb_33356 [translate_table: standard]